MRLLLLPITLTNLSRIIIVGRIATSRESSRANQSFYDSWASYLDEVDDINEKGNA